MLDKAYLGWEDGLVAGGTLGSKHPVVEKITTITDLKMSPVHILNVHHYSAA